MGGHVDSWGVPALGESPRRRFGAGGRSARRCETVTTSRGLCARGVCVADAIPWDRARTRCVRPGGPGRARRARRARPVLPLFFVLLRTDSGVLEMPRVVFFIAVLTWAWRRLRRLHGTRFVGAWHPGGWCVAAGFLVMAKHWRASRQCHPWSVFSAGRRVCARKCPADRPQQGRSTGRGRRRGGSRTALSGWFSSRPGSSSGRG